MIPVCGDSAMAIVDQRFAKTPRPKRPEESRAISAGREDSRRDDSLRCCRQAHADKRQARSKSAAIRRVESANPPRVPQARAPMRMLTKPAPPVEETSAQRSRRKGRALVRAEIITWPTTLPGKAPGFQSARALSDAVANATLAAETQSTDFPSYAPAASSGAGMRRNRPTIVPL